MRQKLEIRNWKLEIRKQFLVSSLRSLIIGLTIVLSAMGNPLEVKATHTPHIFPKRANYFLPWRISDAEARQLAKWDLLILDMETQVTSRAQLELILRLNPDIILLAYLTSQEIRRDALSGGSIMRARLAQKIPDAWYLADTTGERRWFWPGTYLLNPSAATPLVHGQRLPDVMAEFVANEILSTGLWNGVFYDNTWDNITWIVPNPDLDRDRRIDSAPDESWRLGMRRLYDETRRLSGGEYLIVGNGTTRAYREAVNGQMIENFLPFAWTPTMKTYAYLEDGGPDPRLNIINANTGNRGGKNNYRAMRFGLGSALLGNGYYSFDYGDQDHGQLWYYDEYDIDLGQGSGAAVALNGGREYGRDVWRRDFDHGIALVNSMDVASTAGLNGEFEKLRGADDPAVNDGAIVSETVIGAHDGLILLKTLDRLDDIVFTNGAFARFLRPDGARVRNGFFLFESAYAGGAQIARIDLDQDGARDLLVARQNRLSGWRADGQLLLKLFPYGANYKGEIRLAVGDLDGNGKSEIVVAPSGDRLPVKVYSRHGELLRSDLYPLGANYSGGLYAAVGNVQGSSVNELVIGSGAGVVPEVLVYEAGTGYAWKARARWRAFPPHWRGGVRVAAGNIDGEGLSEIIVGAGPGAGPVIRVFDGKGMAISPEITVYRAASLSGIDVRALDVDFDGEDDIVALSNGL